ncbi:hypothetical protein K440DRAFT_642393 [Wilcoxina mikolae CBS 423.85]|nr:hypothetical protein K440DRAFT_642393 [Wilcoxina mikolae CBS 423.85]
MRAVHSKCGVHLGTGILNRRRFFIPWIGTYKSCNFELESMNTVVNMMSGTPRGVASVHGGLEVFEKRVMEVDAECAANVDYPRRLYPQWRDSSPLASYPRYRDWLNSSLGQHIMVCHSACGLNVSVPSSVRKVDLKVDRHVLVVKPLGTLLGTYIITRDTSFRQNYDPFPSRLECRAQLRNTQGSAGR